MNTGRCKYCKMVLFWLDYRPYEDSGHVIEHKCGKGPWRGGEKPVSIQSQVNHSHPELESRIERLEHIIIEMRKPQ